MLHGYDIICLSSIDWDFIWQGHQEIMSTFARHGNRVLFIENTGVRNPQLRDLPRLRKRVRDWFHGTKGFRQERDGLVIYSPLILPFPYSRIARWINRALLLRAIQRWMRAMTFRPAVVWAFLPTSLARDLIRELEPAVTVYYCIDDFASSSRAARRIRHSESRLFREVTLIFVTSQKLRERARALNDRVYLFPFGVDFEAFERIRMSPDEIPNDLRHLPRPIIGYVGGIHQWIDQELVAIAAKRLPAASFVFVGPRQTEVSRLAQCPNVHFLGAQSHAEVPRYVKGFDLGIVPYRVTDYTAHVYPTKLNEYLAMGIPVVATDLPEIRRFNTEHGPVVTIAQDSEGFVEGIREMCGHNSAEEIRARIQVARENSWQARIAQMSQHIEEALGVHRATRDSWEQKLHGLYRMARRRVLRFALGFAFIYLLLFRSPLIWCLAEPLRWVDVIHPAEVIVVFAGGVGESGRAGEGYQERVKHAVDLYHAGFASHLIFSSGYAFVFQEAEMMKELAMASGIPASAIFLETKATNTFENVARVQEMLNERGWRSVLLVSSPYHMRRAVWTFHKVAPGVTVIPAPIPESRFYARGRAVSLEQIGGIWHEYLGILYYWWKGWI